MACIHEFRENVSGSGYYCIHCLLPVLGKNRLDKIREKETEKEEKSRRKLGCKIL
jgi:hypothetical protein